METDDDCLEKQLKYRGVGASVSIPGPGRSVRLPRAKTLKAADAKAYNAAHDGVAKASKAGTICVHCRKGRVNRPKGLCWHCYYTPGVRDLYPSTSRYARRGVRNFAGVAPPAAWPTNFAPGTEGKVEVMTYRASVGQQIFHPADARYDGDPVTLDWLAEYARRGFTLPETRAA